MAQYGRPSSDVSVGMWYESVGDTQTNIYTTIDEATRSDTDYIYSGANRATLCEVGLSSVTDPESSSGHTARYALRRNKTNKSLTLVVRLMQGASQIAAWTHADPPGTLTGYSQTLSSAQADSITNYADLRFEFEVTVNGGGGILAEVSWAELEVPDASVGITQTVTQVIEADTLQVFASAKVKGITFATESSLAQVVGGLKEKALGLVSETDISQAVSVSKIKAIGQSVETNIAQTISAGGEIVQAVAQVIETNTVQPVSSLKNRIISQVTEADIGHAVTSLKERVVSQVSESDTVQALSSLKVRVIAQAVETNVAQVISVSSVIIKSIGQVVESNVVLAISRNPIARLVGQVIEGDTAQAISSLKERTINQISESGTAQSISSLKAKIITQASESSFPHSISVVGPIVKALGQVIETNIARSITKFMPAQVFGYVFIRSKIYPSLIIEPSINISADIESKVYPTITIEMQGLDLERK